jgi:SAM-dependent methyltransferase
MPYSDEYFDVVTTTDVLEHVFDLNDAVKKILAVLKCDGVLIVRVPYKEDLSSYLDPACPYEFIHLRSFDEFNLIALFEKIFNVKVLEWTFSGRKAGLLKVGNDFRYYAGAVRRLLLIVRWLNGRLYDYLTNIVCRPVEINMVIRKVHRSER